MADWYASVFELEEVLRADPDHGRFSLRILSGGRLNVELIRLHGLEPPEDTGAGIFKTGLHTRDARAVHRRLLDLGVSVDPEPVEDARLGVLTFVLRDPEGNRIQVFESVFESPIPG